MSPTGETNHPDHPAGELTEPAQPTVAVPQATVALPQGEPMTQPQPEAPNSPPEADVGHSEAMGPYQEKGWRYEVMDNGGRYVMRRGSGDLRKTAKGGTFSQLGKERQDEYERNRQQQRAAKARAAAERGAQRG